jgi:predicted nuclease of predicted toxin-antitoxin system
VRFLADESCDYRVVEALRASGHDVVAVVEESSGAPDPEVFARSRREHRVLITEDKDFGRLAVAAELGRQGGLLLVRCPEGSRTNLPQTITALVATLGERLLGTLAVWTPKRIRLRQIPGGGEGMDASGSRVE